MVGLVSFVCDATCQISHSDRHFGTHSAGGAHNHGSKGAIVDICDPLKVFTSSFIGDSSVVVGNRIREVALGKRVEHAVFEESVLLLSPKTSNSDVRSRLVTSVCCLHIQYFTRELIQLRLNFDIIVNLATVFSEEKFLLVVTWMKPPLLQIWEWSSV